MNKPRTISYDEKLELFNKKLDDFSVVVREQFTQGKSTATIKNIISELDLPNETYFSIEYFYEGLTNTKKIIDGSKQDIHFIFWVICSLLYEKYLRSSSSRTFEYFQKLYSGNCHIIIHTKTSISDLPLKLEEYEKFFITYKLPYLKNYREICNLNTQIDDPETKFHIMCTNLANKEKDIKESLSNHQKQADELVNFIKTQQTNLNFVGLGKAFKQITEEKEANQNSVKNALILCFIILFLIPVIAACFLFGEDKPNLYLCIPATTMEILFLYAFRLFYQQYLFIKSELLQVSLRHNLCAFIESYMEFKKNNSDNTVTLFEQLIFSNIISDEKKVPATVDGLESVAELIRCLKK